MGGHMAEVGANGAPGVGVLNLLIEREGTEVRVPLSGVLNTVGETRPVGSSLQGAFISNAEDLLGGLDGRPNIGEPCLDVFPGFSLQVFHLGPVVPGGSELGVEEVNGVGDGDLFGVDFANQVAKTVQLLENSVPILGGRWVMGGVTKTAREFPAVLDEVLDAGDGVKMVGGVEAFLFREGELEGPVGGSTAAAGVRVRVAGTGAAGRGLGVGGGGHVNFFERGGGGDGQGVV
jgi:hypothetical protein